MENVHDTESYPRWFWVWDRDYSSVSLLACTCTVQQKTLQVWKTWKRCYLKLEHVSWWDTSVRMMHFNLKLKYLSKSLSCSLEENKKLRDKIFDEVQAWVKYHVNT